MQIYDLQFKKIEPGKDDGADLDTAKHYLCLLVGEDPFGRFPPLGGPRFRGRGFFLPPVRTDHLQRLN
jgi:hypothetical protein